LCFSFFFLTAKARRKIKRENFALLRLSGSKKPVLQTKGIRNSKLTHSIRAVRNFRTTEGWNYFQSFLTAELQRIQSEQILNAQQSPPDSRRTYIE
jgi:hypothetical protein